MKGKMINYPEFILKTNMRRLWIEQVIYTRLYIISTIGLSTRTSDIKFIAKRIIRNYDDISNTFKPYYGKDFSISFKDLFKEHILTIAEFMDKTIKGKVEESIIIKRHMYDNTEKITDLLSKANPNLPKSVIRSILFEYLDTTEKEFVSRYHEDYKEDIDTFDNLQNQMTQLADVLSESIIKKYPAKFVLSESNSRFDQLLG